MRAPVGHNRTLFIGTEFHVMLRTLRLDSMVEQEGDESKTTLRYLYLIPLGEGELMKDFQ